MKKMLSSSCKHFLKESLNQSKSVPRPPVLKVRELIRVLETLGFFEYHRVGSHAQFKHPDGRRTTISIHQGEMCHLVRSVQFFVISMYQWMVSLMPFGEIVDSPFNKYKVHLAMVILELRQKNTLSQRTL